ncbi:MAG: YihY/virulence factor BrkB family protein [Kiritimatiellae bacterium]|nr:YihY/virulence factor BrkB family protein [Kiritimatiellia bacterium]
MKAKIRKIRESGFVKWCGTTLKLFLDNHCSMHAAGLTYFSMLALVPILCILLLAAKAFRAEEYVRKEINERIDVMITNIEKGQDDELAVVAVMDEEDRRCKREAAEAFGRQAREYSNMLFEKIEQFDVGTLGWIGFALLLWTVVSSVGMVEVSFNEIWEVEKPRPVWKRAALYLSVVVLAPLIGALAMSVPIMNIIKNIIVSTLGATWLTQWASDGLIWFLDSWILRLIVSFFFASLDFAIMFSLLPNCRVNMRYAWRGGLITAALFGGWMKLCAIAQVGIAKSSALYGSFAFLPIVLAWLYMSWQIVLLGSCSVRAFHIRAAEAN